MRVDLRGSARDVRYAVRSLTKHPAFAAIAIATIALTVAANAVAFAVLRTLLDPLPYGHAQQLVSVIETDAQTPNPETASYATAHDWAARVTAFESVATWSDAAVRLVRPDGVDLVRGMDVSSNFFDTLGVRMALGRSFRPGEGVDTKDVVVLTHDTWTDLFAADPNVVGRSVAAVGGAFTVVGILPAEFHPLHMSNPAERPRVFIANDHAQADCRTAACRRTRVIARLRAGVSADLAQAEVRNVTVSLVHEYPNQYPTGE